MLTLFVLSVTVPTNPVGLGCYGGDNYTCVQFALVFGWTIADSCEISHDAQAVVYKGPDTRYTGKEIMFAYNEDSLTILGEFYPFAKRGRN